MSTFEVADLIVRVSMLIFILNFAVGTKVTIWEMPLILTRNFTMWIVKSVAVPTQLQQRSHLQ